MEPTSDTIGFADTLLHIEAARAMVFGEVMVFVGHDIFEVKNSHTHPVGAFTLSTSSSKNFRQKVLAYQIRYRHSKMINRSCDGYDKYCKTLNLEAEPS